MGRACTGPWYSLVRQDMEVVLGVGALERCSSMGKSKWAAFVQPAVDVHYRQHWIRRIEAKLDVPLAEAAAPDALVGRVVHKPAAAFGRGGGGMLAGLVTRYNAGRLTWSVEYDDEASQAPEELGAADMGLYGPGVDAGDAGDEAHRGVLREYLRVHGGRARAWYLSGPPALARWHVHARTNGGLAGSYGRVGPAGRAHCSTCTGAVETTMHMYLHCPLHHAPRVRLLQAVDAWRQAQASDAFTGEPAPAPSRLGALRWVHSDSALVEGRLVGPSAVRLGASLRLAAYVFHREATKARRVRGGVRAVGGQAAPL